MAKTRTKLITDRAVLFSVTLRGPGVRRKVSSAKVEVDADKSLVHVSKDILDSKEVQAVFALGGKYKARLATRALPSLIRDGIYLLPIGLVAEVDEWTAKFRAERQKLVEIAVEAYPQQVKAAMKRLRGLADRSDYPPVEQFRSAFCVEAMYLMLETPSGLKDVRAGLFERERRKAEAMWRDTVEVIKAALREAFAELVGHAVDRLQDREGGKPKVFRDSMVEKLTDFLTTFEKRNLADDAALADLVGKAKALTKGVSPGALRDNARLRDRVRKGFEEVKGVLDGMLVDQPARRMRLGEEEG